MTLTDVGGGTPVLEITVSLGSNMPGNTDRSTTVGDTRRERSDVASLMTASQTKLIVLSVDGNVLVVPFAELGNGGLDGLHSSGLTHSLGGVVGVAASAVPVTGKRLGVEGDLDAPLFGDALKEVAGHPEVVTHGDTLTRADLELPLGGHDLGVDAADVDTGVQACAVVGFNHITGEDLASS